MYERKDWEFSWVTISFTSIERTFPVFQKITQSPTIPWHWIKRKEKKRKEPGLRGGRYSRGNSTCLNWDFGFSGTSVSEWKESTLLREGIGSTFQAVAVSHASIKFLLEISSLKTPIIRNRVSRLFRGANMFLGFWAKWTSSWFSNNFCSITWSLSFVFVFIILFYFILFIFFFFLKKKKKKNCQGSKPPARKMAMSAWTHILSSFSR